ncbi:exodeoxyribonuclease VII small subunit [Ureibacillus xyleni]|uniref:Exodeoxyribonuclease 7 small subunit n=1 Tax=Ureibacillus xyleni TaxID=614648 RepID=A0A285TUK2_9BACL|nr:exodeoxyribonuclease VII small subunit [Ureibacillus xyleni]SOC27111.1 exodeoxyribonuclease VII small subunit [Ureibacillus xyleni]
MGSEQKFAEAMQELEEIVRKLEQGDVQLEEAIDLYKKGMELSHFCHEKLQNAEKQLISIVNENGEKQNFEPTNGVDNN